MTSRKVEVLVIGSGPGGYTAAIRLGQLGREVIIVEREIAGGICLNVGCIPSKALISASKIFEKIQHAGAMGIVADSVSVDMEKMQVWKQGIIEKLTRGVRHLCKSAGVEFVKGEATFIGERRVQVSSAEKAEIIEAENIIIATGSHPVEIPGFEFDGERVLSSTHALALKAVPSRMVVIGGGYIGMELSMLYSKLGTQVSIVEMMDQLLSGFEDDLVKVIARQLRKEGIDYYVRAHARGWRRRETGVDVSVETDHGELVLEGEFVLVTVGRRPHTKELELEKTGLSTDQDGFIPVNGKRQTSVPGVYAIGDVAGNPMLAHKSSREAEMVAEVIAAAGTAVDDLVVPAVVFTDPELATVGLSEKEAREQGYEVLVGRFPFAASGRAITMQETDGFVKIVADKRSKRLLGLHVVGPEASDLISEGAVALSSGASLESIAHTIHPHPTLSEALMEAAKHALGKAIHVTN